MLCKWRSTKTTLDTETLGLTDSTSMSLDSGIKRGDDVGGVSGVLGWDCFDSVAEKAPVKMLARAKKATVEVFMMKAGV